MTNNHAARLRTGLILSGLLALLACLGCSEGHVEDVGSVRVALESCTGEGSTRETTTACGVDDEGFVWEKCVGGFWEPDVCIADDFAGTSASCHTDELTEAGEDCNIDDDDYTDWDDMLSDVNNEDCDRFIISEGDYTDWGVLVLGEDDSGTSSRWRTIQYESSTHPVDRTDHAYVYGIQVSNSDYWIVSGLTMRDLHETGVSGLAYIQGGSESVTFDSLLIENVNRSYGIRIRSSKYACVQNSAILDEYEADVAPGSDGVAIQIKPVGGVAVTQPSVYNNEIRNWNDGIQISLQNTSSPGYDVEVVGARIEGNDIYLTSDVYTAPTDDLACGFENAIDIKNGADTGQGTVRYNRFWGYRWSRTADCPTGWTGTSGSYGEAVLIHKHAYNYRVRNNIIFDSAEGIRIQAYNDPLDANPYNYAKRDILVDHNVLSDISIFRTGDYGAAFDVRSDIEFRTNWVSQSAALCRKPGQFQPGDPTWTGNVYIDTPYDDVVDECELGSNNYERDDDDAIDYQFPYKRWTGVGNAMVLEDALLAP